MNHQRIIVVYKEGIKSEMALPINILNNTKRLYNISSKIESFKNEFPDAARLFPNDEELFENSIYPEMTDDEKRLYRTYIISCNDPSECEIIYNQLINHQGVEHVQYDELNRLYLHPNDPLFSSQWNLTRVHCEEAWDKSQGENIVVAVIDSGIYSNHPDIYNNMWRDAYGNFGYNFSDGNNDTEDYDGHGTHVAGIISAEMNNAKGISGDAPRCKIMAVKIFPNPYDSACAQAIKYAVDNGARVLNNSWGPTSRRPSNPILEAAVKYAGERGVIPVFAAGNENDDVQYYSPVNQPHVISVASTDYNDKRSVFSNYGSSVGAPGENILSLGLTSSSYVTKSGTSMARPLVPGFRTRSCPES